MKNTYITTISIVAMLIFMSGVAMAAVWTDQLDYSPGSVVTISGNNSDGIGYLPGETVNVSVNGPGSYDSKCSATVDSSGAWSCQVTLASDLSAEGSYTYTAVGQTSNVSQSGMFTDSGSLSYSPTTTQSLAANAGGASVSFSQSVTAPANNGAFSATLHIAGTGTTPIPASWVSASPTPLSFVTTSTNGDTKSWTVTFAVPSGTVAGTYTADIKANPSKPGVGEGAGTHVSLVVTAKGPGSVTVSNLPSSGIYGGGFTATYTVLGDGITSVKSSTLSVCTVSGNVVSYIGVGTCTLTAHVAEGTNYLAADGTPQSITIGKADPTIIVTPYSVTYDSNSHTATGTAKGVQNEDLAGLDLGGTIHTNAGDYPSDSWTFTDSTGNYKDTSGIVHDSIDKADPTITVTPYAVTYDGSSHTATGTVKGVQNEDLAGLDLGGTIHTDAGTYSTDAWTFTDSTGNYKDKSGTVSDSISKADATITITPYSVTYDGNSHTAIGTATGVKGESLAGLDLSGTIHTDAGTYSTDVWTFTDVNGNYKDASGTVPDSIARADATISVNGYTGIYDGNSHGASGTAKGISNTDLSGSLNLGSAFTNVPGGTAHWIFTGGANYNDASGDVNIVISRADATIVVAPYTVVYDSNAHTATVIATGVKGEDLKAYVGLSGTIHTNANDYPSDQWSFADPNGNYNSASGTVHDVISKATATITITPYSVTYDGNPHIATGIATGVKGESLIGLDLSGTMHTDVGTSTDPWTFTDVTGNYKDASGIIADSIAKADAIILVTPYSVTLDSNPHTATGTAKGVKGESLSGLGLSGTTHTYAGDYPSDSWTFTDVTGNYKDASGTVHDSISYASSGNCNGAPGHQIIQPINPDGSSVWKKGSTVPAKFRACDINGNSIGTPNPGVVTAFKVKSITQGAGSIDETPISTTPDTSFRWDPTDKLWIFNIKTSNLVAGNKYTYTITLNDLSTIEFTYGVR